MTTPPPSWGLWPVDTPLTHFSNRKSALFMLRSGDLTIGDEHDLIIDEYFQPVCTHKYNVTLPRVKSLCKYCMHTNIAHLILNFVFNEIGINNT